MVVPCYTGSVKCQSQYEADRAVCTSASSAWQKCQFAAKSVSRGKMNECLKVTIATKMVYFTTQWYTGFGKNTVFDLKCNKTCGPTAVFQNVALAVKYPYQIVRQMSDNFQNASPTKSY